MITIDSTPSSANKVNIEVIRKNEVKSLIETRFETEVEIHPDEL